MSHLYIVITSIFEATEAVRKYSNLPGCYLIVVGDKKTPGDWHCNNTDFLSVESIQNRFRLDQCLPYNHYSRKMLGYLHAMSLGAQVIVDTDDDNIPKPEWEFPNFCGEYKCIPEDLGFINIYSIYTSQKIWPRGLPLQYINNDDPNRYLDATKVKSVNVGVWQGLADEDPDVDAIYRLSLGDMCIFDSHDPYVLEKGTISPFNSQNTAFRKELFPLLYLPAYVTFRFTDILRGLVAQPIMWMYEYCLGFTNATVLQKRNQHDLLKDFESEIPMYLASDKIVQIVASAISSDFSIMDNLHQAYRALEKHKIVCNKEIEALDAWLEDCRKFH
jgi:hypothetical protein